MKYVVISGNTTSVYEVDPHDYEDFEELLFEEFGQESYSIYTYIEIAKVFSEATRLIMAEEFEIFMDEESKE